MLRLSKHDHLSKKLAHGLFEIKLRFKFKFQNDVILEKPHFDRAQCRLRGAEGSR
jgi:hypothetical protein